MGFYMVVRLILKLILNASLVSWIYVYSTTVYIDDIYIVWFQTGLGYYYIIRFTIVNLDFTLRNQIPFHNSLELIFRKVVLLKTIYATFIWLFPLADKQERSWFAIQVCILTRDRVLHNVALVLLALTPIVAHYTRKATIQHNLIVHWDRSDCVFSSCFCSLTTKLD